MRKLVGWLMLVTAVFCACLTWFRAHLITSLTEVGIVRDVGGFHMLLMIFFGFFPVLSYLCNTASALLLHLGSVGLIII